MYIHRLQIGKAYQLVNIGMIAHIAFYIWICVTPLFRRHTKQGYIQQIASLAYTALICCDDKTSGIRLSLMASVWIR